MAFSSSVVAIEHTATSDDWAWRLFALALGWSAIGCGNGPSGLEPACLDRQRNAIWGANPEASSGDLRLSVAEETAIGWIGGLDGALLCSGTLIRRRWVLTARHCDQPAVSFSTHGSANAQARVSRRFVHPDRDAMLLELEPHPALDGARVVPLPLFGGELGAHWIGRTVTLAGFGRTETGTQGKRLFVSEPVSEVNELQVVVDGEGTRGACMGDSGGPLLAREGAGAVQVLGVLSQGATSCRGLDRYERVDLLRAWIERTITQADADPCGTLGWEGTCDLGEPRWCAGDHIVSETCVNKQICGYDVKARGYRCVDEDNPCAGQG